MIKYFKELETPNSHYLDLLKSKPPCKILEIKSIPIEFFIKYAYLFKNIEEYDPLLEKNNKKIYTNPKELTILSEEELDLGMIQEYEISIEDIYHLLTSTKYILTDHKDTGLSINGILKLFELKEKYKNNYKGSNFENHFYDYYINIIDMSTQKDNLITSSKKTIINCLECSKKILEYQNRLSENDKQLFNEALDYISKLKTKIELPNHEPIKFHLPNKWFITPFDHLYNSMGPNAHKEANLIYPLYYGIYRDDHIDDFRGYLYEIRENIKNGYISIIDYKTYTNLIYDFPCIFEDKYYDMKHEDKIRYRFMNKKSYNPKLIKLIIGFKSANAGLFKFFDYLKKNSINYYDDLELLRKMDIDEILVRCCGFHKVSSVKDRTITTSCINYEEEFIEYINRGWTIDFVKPYILNPCSKRLEEYDDELLIIRRMHLSK